MAGGERMGRRRTKHVGEDAGEIGNDPQEAFGLNGVDQRDEYGGEHIALSARPLWKSRIYV